MRTLVDWATAHALLDPGHRRSERAWHCMGQKVLSLRPTKDGGLDVRAGIHYSKPAEAPAPFHVAKGSQLLEAERKAVASQVEQGIQERLHGSKHHHPDEHYLQAVIRRAPDLVGVEQPALREVPAWRPKGTPGAWGRGYIDLVGLDGAGDIRLVETKLAKNKDELLILQGLDYFIWSRVYDVPLRARLSSGKGADVVIDYVVAVTPGSTAVELSPYARKQAEALDVPWRFRFVADWFHNPATSLSRPTVTTFPDEVFPT